MSGCLTADAACSQAVVPGPWQLQWPTLCVAEPPLSQEMCPDHTDPPYFLHTPICCQCHPGKGCAGGQEHSPLCYDAPQRTPPCSDPDVPLLQGSRTACRKHNLAAHTAKQVYWLCSSDFSLRTWLVYICRVLSQAPACLQLHFPTSRPRHLARREQSAACPPPKLSEDLHTGRKVLTLV